MSGGSSTADCLPCRRTAGGLRDGSGGIGGISQIAYGATREGLVGLGEGSGLKTGNLRVGGEPRAVHRHGASWWGTVRAEGNQKVALLGQERPVAVL